MDELINNDPLTMLSEQIFPDSSLDYYQPTAHPIQPRFIDDLWDGFEDITDSFIDIIGGIDIDIGGIDIDINIGGGDKDPITGEANPQISINDTTIVEGNKGQKTAKFKVTLDQESDEVVKVNYTTANGSAKAGKDYKTTKGTLTFQPGQTQKTIAIPILGDTLDEENEKFQVLLSQPQNAELGDEKAIGTIKDDDVPPGKGADSNFKNARNLGRLNAEFINTDKIGYTEVGERDTNDFYRFRLPHEGKLRVVLDELFDDANISLYEADETLISTSTEKGTTPEQIVQTLDPGVYYLEVTPQGSDRTDYRIELKFL